jgi:hypothetical protein
MHNIYKGLRKCTWVILFVFLIEASKNESITLLLNVFDKKKIKEHNEKDLSLLCIVYILTCRNKKRSKIRKGILLTHQGDEKLLGSLESQNSNM